MFMFWNDRNDACRRSGTGAEHNAPAKRLHVHTLLQIFFKNSFVWILDWNDETSVLCSVTGYQFIAGHPFVA